MAVESTSDILLLVVRFIHIVAGVIWIGGLVYAGMVVGRSLQSAPPAVRGPAMAKLGPTGFRFLIWAGTVTIVFGVIMQLLMHPIYGETYPLWNVLLGIAFLLALTLMGIAGMLVGPTFKKLVAQPPPEEAMRLQKRLMVASFLGLGLGVTILFLMVYATKLHV